MPRLYNLIVDLEAPQPSSVAPGYEISPPQRADERTLAWIDATFSGTWSSETAAGSNVVASCDSAPVGFATLDARGLKYRWLQGIARERDVGLFGPFGVAPEARKTGLGIALLQCALAGLRERGYRRALIAAAGGDSLLRYYADAAHARVVEEYDRAALLAPPPRTLVMASGNGSNFGALLDATRAGALPIDVVALVCNDARAHAMRRAHDAGIPAQLIEWQRKAETRAQYDKRLLDAVRAERPDLVVLLGWMHLLAPAFVRAFPEMLNLHPAFLPLDPQRDAVVTPDGSEIAAFRGQHAVRDALAAGSPWVGATVHRVTAATDRGPVMARKPLRMGPDEEEAHLMARLHEVEHRLVPAAITRWLFERPLSTGEAVHI